MTSAHPFPISLFLPSRTGMCHTASTSQNCLILIKQLKSPGRCVGYSAPPPNTLVTCLRMTAAALETRLTLPFPTPPHHEWGQALLKPGHPAASCFLKGPGFPPHAPPCSLSHPQPGHLGPSPRCCWGPQGLQKERPEATVQSRRV